jgi:hypothetical protein
MYKRIIKIIIVMSLIINIVVIGSLIISNKIRRSYRDFAYIGLNKLFKIEDPEDLKGKWGKIDNSSLKKELTPKQKASIEKLKSIGYLSGTKMAPKQRNVIVYDENLAYNGYNLLCSGHGPEALLMDMEGNIMHKWRKDIFSVWSDYKVISKNHEAWRRIHLFENGDLLAIFEGIGLIKIDNKSNLIWANPCGAHHDLFVSKDNRIFILTRKSYINSKYNEFEPILEDFITILDQDGNEIKSISILNCLENSKYAPILNDKKITGDFMHTNTIELIEDENFAKFQIRKKGDVLISILGLDLIGIVDIDKEEIVWALSNMWKAQHQPLFLSNGHMLIFDNKGRSNNSSVIEFDPLSQKIFWKYSGTNDNPFYSKTCGSCQPLPNGNILISDTESGKAFEVTQDMKIVWEFFNPHRAGKDQQLIAAIYEIIRLDHDFPLIWLEEKNN